MAMRSVIEELKEGVFIIEESSNRSDGNVGLFSTSQP
jgi:hypothetical protein